MVVLCPKESGRAREKEKDKDIDKEKEKEREKKSVGDYIYKLPIQSEKSSKYGLKRVV
jgi:hypothetical protein